MFDRKTEDRSRHLSKREVFTDDIMRKGHVHQKDNKSVRVNNRQKLHQIDLNHLDEIDDFLED